MKGDERKGTNHISLPLPTATALGDGGGGADARGEGARPPAPRRASRLSWFFHAREDVRLAVREGSE